MSRIIRTGLVLAVGLVLIASSARAWKISDLEAEIAALKSRIGQVEEREEKYRKQVDAAKQASQDQVMQVRKDQADLKLEIERLKSQMDQLQETVGDLNQKITALETQVQSQAQTLAQQSATAQAEPTSETKESGPGTDIYNLALDYFKKGKYDIARDQFQAFLSANPKDSYSDNAQFWIGETYFQQKNFKYAINEYAKVSEKYPKANKVPASLYKIGVCFESLGKKPEAQALYKQVMDAYPNSDEAAKAKDKLDKLQKSEKPK